MLAPGLWKLEHTAEFPRAGTGAGVCYLLGWLWKHWLELKMDESNLIFIQKTSFVLDKLP